MVATAGMLSESVQLGSVTRCTLHVYTFMAEGIVIMAEMEWAAFFRSIPLLEGWAMRGLFQIFVGVLVQTGALLDRDSSGATTESSEKKGGFVLFVSWYLIMTGIFYFVLVSWLPGSNQTSLYMSLANPPRSIVANVPGFFML